MMRRKATAVWHGGLKTGKGTISSESGVLENTPYSFGTRFEQQRGTNPEELVAAAHAGCFAMALSAQLEGAGMTAETLEVTATVKLEKQEAGWAVTESHLELTAHIPGADPDKFEVAAETAKANCPISKLLNAKVTLTATLN
jgi:osmotically inducible protein OsmC